MLSSEMLFTFIQELDPEIHVVRCWPLKTNKFVTRINTPVYMGFEHTLSLNDFQDSEDEILTLYEHICITLRDFNYIIMQGDPLTYWTYKDDRWQEIPRHEAVKRWLEQDKRIERVTP